MGDNPEHESLQTRPRRAGSSWYDDINSNFDRLDVAGGVLGKQHGTVFTGTKARQRFTLVIPGGTIKANGARINASSFTGSVNKTMK